MNSPDPTALMTTERPALVDLEGQGAVFVANASTSDNGWLRIKEWNGTSAKLPPHRVNAVRYLETEHYGERRKDGSRPKQLASEEWREEADKITTSDNEGQNPVVADD